MLRTTLRSLWSHKRRLTSTSLAVLLGVAFMSGTLVLSDTVNRVFSDLFADAYEEIDVQVRGTELFVSEVGPTHRIPLDAALLEEVRAVEGVAGAQPWVMSMLATLLDVDGRQAGGPTGAILESWVDHDEVDFGYRMAEGRPPEADDEVALNVAAAADAGYEVGDEITVLLPEGRTPYRLVGTFRFREADSIAGLVMIQVTLAEAQRVTDQPAALDGIFATAVEGISEEELAERIAPTLPEGAEVRTGEQIGDEEATDVADGFGFISQVLLVFAGIALFVGSFIIYNTFSILVAQRMRELALLRALGASRLQVFGSVLLEAAVVGVVAAVAGIGVGMLLAAGAMALLDAAGFDLPSAGLLLSTGTVIAAVVAGLVVTLASAVAPAVRATRVAPMAALREAAVDRLSASRGRTIAGGVVLAASMAIVAPALVSESGAPISQIGLAAALGLIGLLVIGPVLARPMASVFGAWLPRLRGVTGRLARENAVRSPKRTASTAAALMIGVAMVGFITVFAASTRASITDQVEQAFRADYMVQSPGFSFTRVSPAMADELRDVDGVAVVSSMRAAEAQLRFSDGETTSTFVAALNPVTFSQVHEFQMDQGEMVDLTDAGLAVDRQTAAGRDLELGDVVEVTTPGGSSVELTVEMLTDDPVASQWTMTLAAYEQVSPEQVDALVGLLLEPDVDPTAIRADLEAVVDRYPGMTLQDQDDLVSGAADQVTALLNIVYGLLAISIVIAVIGIANTISLSVHERTRELGLLRAVGMTRGQLRATIRWEAVLVALMGTVLGLALGVGIGFVMTQALATQGLDTFTLPVGQLAMLLILGASVGIIAALLPAYRAARLDILKAIATE